MVQISADWVLKRIQEGKKVRLNNAVIVGDLDLNKLDLPTQHIERKLQKKRWYSNDDVKIVQSSIDITGSIVRGIINFSNATFRNTVNFRGVTFNGSAVFSGATFNGDANFIKVTFDGAALFSGATFNGDAYFIGATFSVDASFSDATFKGDAFFSDATFNGGAIFSDATFNGDAVFSGATFNGSAVFSGLTPKEAYRDHAFEYVEYDALLLNFYIYKNPEKFNEETKWYIHRNILTHLESIRNDFTTHFKGLDFDVRRITFFEGSLEIYVFIVIYALPIIEFLKGYPEIREGALQLLADVDAIKKIIVNALHIPTEDIESRSFAERQWGKITDSQYMADMADQESKRSKGRSEGE